MLLSSAAWRADEAIAYRSAIHAEDGGPHRGSPSTSQMLWYRYQRQVPRWQTLPRTPRAAFNAQIVGDRKDARYAAGRRVRKLAVHAVSHYAFKRYMPVADNNVH